MGRVEGLGVQHTGHFQVKGITGLAGYLLKGVLALVGLSHMLIAGLVIAVMLIGAMF